MTELARLAYGSIEPSPEFILRAHASQINALSFSHDGQFLASGDQNGFACVWSLTTFRPVLLWKAHNESILTVHEWDNSLITHGRDNFIHVFDLPASLPTVSNAAATETPSLQNLTEMTPRCSLPTNALAYCKAAFLPFSVQEAYVATPSALSDELIDVCHLPSCTRTFRSIGKDAWPINDKTGTVMALELFKRDRELVLLAGYEDGRLACFTAEVPVDLTAPRAEEGEGWSLQWYEKGHREPIMSLAVSSDHAMAWTVAADHFVSSFRLSRKADKSKESRVLQRETKHPGRSSIAVRDDGLILAIGGWDGKVRVHSTKSFKPLAVLDFHRDSVYVVAFASTRPSFAQGEVGTEDEMPHMTRTWLAAAGKDQRISLFELYPLDYKPAT